MLKRVCLITVCALSISTVSLGQHSPQALTPYPLPTDVQRSMSAVAGECDVLILGEIHGTQEVPAVAAALLEPLTKLGYGVLALEIPANEQGGLTDWATGKTATVPPFFANPLPDGRSGTETLSLIRTALSPPYNWKLICFDVGYDDNVFQRQLWDNYRDAIQGTDGAPEDFPANQRDIEAMTAISLRRDEIMASNLASQCEPFTQPPKPKVLAISGNLHARTENRAKPDKPWAGLWPSFAAVLQTDNPGWKVRSVDVLLHSGGYYNAGKVNEVQGRPITKVEMQPTPHRDWDYKLSLPRATPATFLSEPSVENAPAPPPVSDKKD